MIEDTRYTSLPLSLACGADQVQACVLPIVLDDFSIEDFSRYAIDLPPAIARSVLVRQAEYFYGRMVARQALRKLNLGIGTEIDTVLDLDRCQIGSGPSREPLWPAGIAGSISHTRRYAAAAVTQQRGAAVGIDLETIISAGTRDAVLSIAISPAEHAYLRAVSARLPLDTLLTMVFSAKESFFKAAFATVQRYFDFDAIALDTIDFDAATLQFTICEPLSPLLTTGTRLSIHYQMIDTETVLTCCLPAAQLQATPKL